jgi:hypothetical protein
METEKEQRATTTWVDLLDVLRDRTIHHGQMQDTHQAMGLREEIIIVVSDVLEFFDGADEVPSAQHFLTRCDAVNALRSTLQSSFSGKPDLQARELLTNVLDFACSKSIITRRFASIITNKPTSS